MLRCIRFRCKLSVDGKSFRIAVKTAEAVLKCKDGIKTLSGERITEELNKILLDKGLPAVNGRVGVGFKVKHEPYSFDVSEKQPTK